MTKAEYEKRIAKIMQSLKCDRAEAEEILAEDLEIDKMSMKDVTADLTAEQKKAVKIATNVGQKTTEKVSVKRERKIDEEKVKIIAEIAKFAENFAENVEITNISKVIEFNIGENHYKLDLIKQRKPKN